MHGYYPIFRKGLYWLPSCSSLVHQADAQNVNVVFTRKTFCSPSRSATACKKGPFREAFSSLLLVFLACFAQKPHQNHQLLARAWCLPTERRVSGLINAKSSALIINYDIPNAARTFANYMLATYETESIVDMTPPYSTSASRTALLSRSCHRNLIGEELYRHRARCCWDLQRNACSRQELKDV